MVTSHEATDGVIELIEQLRADDLRRFEARLARHDILIGNDERGLPIRLRSPGPIVLIAGSPGASKSPATALITRLVEQEYQCCLVDARGNHEGIERLVPLGTVDRVPVVDEVLQVLANPESNCAINLIGIRPEERPSFLAALLPRLQGFRAQTGRPAWIAIDEAERLLPAGVPLTYGLYSMILTTSEPGRLAAQVLLSVDGAGIPLALPVELEPGEALIWNPRPGEVPIRVRLAPPRATGWSRKP
jgi:hypothetical protein